MQYQNCTVGELVTERPSRARVFERFGIDYCCGGGQNVADAATQQQVDPAALYAALRAADAQPPTPEDRNWATAPLPELIDHIVATHHAYLRRELPRLMTLADKVESVHGARHAELGRVRETFEGVSNELQSHMLKEERILFPLIRQMADSGAFAAGHCGSVRNPIRVMEMEHESAGGAAEELRQLTADYTPPEDACNSYRALLAGLAAFEADLHQHVHKENNILFPRAIAFEEQCMAADRAG
jgi:regulator of cell morphogenesis and NO signaling